MEQYYDFDDILLLPVPSTVNSRGLVNTKVSLLGLELDLPIIAAPMKGITGVELVKALSDRNLLGILHRFMPTQEFKDSVEFLQHSADQFGLAIGLDDYERAEIAFNSGASVVCVDTANGYISSLLNFLKSVRRLKPDGTLLMAGNVATPEGVFNLAFNGADMVRVGIGSGGLCTTRNVTGVGVPQYSAIRNSSYIEDTVIVADGGIRNVGDTVKALNAGASVAMFGSLFALVYEAENSNGQISGMSSKRHQEDYFGKVTSIEGLTKAVTPSMSLDEFLEQFSWGLRSACTYLNLDDVNLLHTATPLLSGRGSIKNVGFR